MVYLWFGLVCLIWGSSFILMKKAALVFGPLTVGAGRVLGGAIVLGLVLGVAWRWRRTTGRAAPPPTKPKSWRDAGPLAVVVALGFVYPFSMQPYLIARLDQSGFIGMMVSLVPLLTIGASVLLLGVWPGWRQWTGVLAGLAAMPVLLGVGRGLGVGGFDFFLAATVPLGYAFSNTWIKKNLDHWGPAALTATACGAAGLVLLPWGLVQEPVALDRVDARAAWAAVGSLLALGVLGVGVAAVLFYRLIQERGPLFAGLVTYVVPVQALLWGWIDGEEVSGGQVAALVVILASVALAQWPARAKAG